MSDAYIVDGLRTAIGSFAGSLSEVRPDDLAALTIRRLLERYPTLDPARITDVILGCANQAGEDNRNVARMALLLAGLPVTRAGRDRESSVRVGNDGGRHRGARAFAAATATFFVAGGVESMTRAPYVDVEEREAVRARRRDLRHEHWAGGS